MGRPHWSAGDYERDRYYSNLRNTDSSELRENARQAEKSGDYLYAQDLYRAAGDDNKAREMGNRQADE